MCVVAETLNLVYLFNNDKIIFFIFQDCDKWLKFLHNFFLQDVY